MTTRGAQYIQAIRGPFLAVLLGGLFALQQASIVGFTRTWPLLIIAIGVLKLLERMVAPPAPYAGGPLP